MAAAATSAGRLWDGLLPELLADIRSRLAVVDRAAFAAACAACTPEAPCLILPGDTEATATIYSLADRQGATVGAPDPAMRRDHVVLGSSGGWLVTADDRGAMRVANPVTGEQSSWLPDITTIPFVSTDGMQYLFIDMGSFAQVRFGGGDVTTAGRFCLTTRGLRWVLYRKVVLSRSRRAAMLILQGLEGDLGAPAFATAADDGAATPSWRVAASRDGVEDAVFHDGQFYSITYSGVVETWTWQRRRGGSSGEFAGRAIDAPPVRNPDNKDGDPHLSRKYLAAAPDGRLMVLFRYKNWVTIDGGRVLEITSLFEVYVLVDGEWEETVDIGDAAVFVGVNGSLCVSAREHRELRAGCVYFTQDDLGESWRHHSRSSRERDSGGAGQKF